MKKTKITPEQAWELEDTLKNVAKIGGKRHELALMKQLEAFGLSDSIVANGIVRDAVFLHEDVGVLKEASVGRDTVQSVMYDVTRLEQKLSRAFTVVPEGKKRRTQRTYVWRVEF